jgi:hypothetical protein
MMDIYNFTIHKNTTVADQLPDSARVDPIPYDKQHYQSAFKQL